MKITIRCFMLVIPLILLNSFESQAITISDVYSGDDNSITSQSTYDDMYADIYLSYGENNIISHATSYGFNNALVNNNSQYFDLTVINSLNPKKAIYLNFYITNNTGFSWSDFHFEIWSRDFDNGIPTDQLHFQYGNNNIFKKSYNDSSVIHFWSTEGQSPGGWQYPNEENTFELKLMVGSNYDIDNFGLRLVATTSQVPLPSTLLLLSTGLIGLGAWTRTKKG